MLVRAPMTDEEKQQWRQRLEAGAHQEAWTFVVQHAWNLEAIKEQLADKEEFRAWPSIQDNQMAPGASPRIFVDAYIATLKEAIEIIEIQRKALRFQQLTAGGQLRAWTFAVEHDWNLEQLREELAKYEDILSRPITENSPMTPGYSPRISADAYIATLKEAIEIIQIQQVDAVVA